MQVAPKTLEEVEWVARRVIGELSEPFVLGENDDFDRDKHWNCDGSAETLLPSNN